MAWTAPRTWVTGETVTAALMNAHLRDNLLETSAATATTAGDIVYADAANSMGSRLGIGSANGSVLASTGSAPVWRTVGQAVGDSTYTGKAGADGDDTPTSFADLSAAGWGPGTTVAVTVTTGTRALVHYGSRFVRNGTAGRSVDISYRVSGATTTVASVSWGTSSESGAANDTHSPGRSHLATLTAGSNVFTLQASATNAADVAVIGFPYLIVRPF
jgi:hypothetical protein